MHKPSEPESLRRGIVGEGDAPCNCTCDKGREPGTEQPQTALATVLQVVYPTVGGEP